MDLCASPEEELQEALRATARGSAATLCDSAKQLRRSCFFIHTRSTHDRGPLQALLTRTSGRLRGLRAHVTIIVGVPAHQLGVNSRGHLARIVHVVVASAFGAVGFVPTSGVQACSASSAAAAARSESIWEAASSPPPSSPDPPSPSGEP
eukprot:COSAG04_NODE_5324_length_1656_cov_2.008992_3_plen_150_part_00